MKKLTKLSLMAALMASTGISINEEIDKVCKPKLNWKEKQSEEEKKFKLQKAKEKRLKKINRRK